MQGSLVYRVNFRTARATQRNPVSKTKQQQKKYPWFIANQRIEHRVPNGGIGSPMEELEKGPKKLKKFVAL